MKNGINESNVLSATNMTTIMKVFPEVKVKGNLINKKLVSQFVMLLARLLWINAKKCSIR